MVFCFPEISPSFRGILLLSAIECLCTHSVWPVHGVMNPSQTAPLLKSFPRHDRSCRTERAYSFISNRQHSRSSALTSVGSFLWGSSEHCSGRHSCLHRGMSSERLLCGAGPHPPWPDPSMGSSVDGNVLILLFLC